MATSLLLDPSRPCQVGDDLLALWLPRGRGRDALADGIVARVRVCSNPECRCTEANLQVVRVDDRAERVVADGEEMKVHWRPPLCEATRPQGSWSLVVDFLTGVAKQREGRELPAALAPFFAEPLPYWVLDHLLDRWTERRGPVKIDWKAQVLEVWEPGILLSTFEAFPESRLDCYVIDGATYQVDTLFCVDPDCPCTETRLVALRFDRERMEVSEVGTAVLPVETMVPVHFEGSGLDHETFVRIYLEWRRRNVPAKERVLELREKTRKRGYELHRIVEERVRSEAHRPSAPPHPGVRKAAPASSTPRPGRNALCPCGSGRKFKRCCGA